MIGIVILIVVKK